MLRADHQGAGAGLGLSPGGGGTLHPDQRGQGQNKRPRMC